MAVAKSNGIDIEYDTIGNSSGRPLLLIMGLASQLVAWPMEFCHKLADHGHYVIRFDNRDIGLSTKIEAGGLPDLMQAMEAFQQGIPVDAPYTLSDMAADTVGLMDALHIESAHVCGQSMGGMIAQVMAIEYPQRTQSLISLESSTGDTTLPTATPAAMKAMMSTPPQDRESYIQYSAGVFRAFAGGSDEYDEELQKEIIGIAYDRLLYPPGFVRQLAAVWASGNRTQALRAISVPALIIHGTHDSLVPLAHGRATADAIAGSRLLEIEGLGHGLAYPALWDEMVDAISGHTTGNH